MRGVFELNSEVFQDERFKFIFGADAFVAPRIIVQLANQLVLNMLHKGFL